MVLWWSTCPCKHSILYKAFFAVVLWSSADALDRVWCTTSTSPTSEQSTRHSSIQILKGLTLQDLWWFASLEQARRAKHGFVYFTCFITRAVHLDIVLDLSTETFLRCLKIFAACRGLPYRFILVQGSFTSLQVHVHRWHCTTLLGREQLQVDLQCRMSTMVGGAFEH